MDIDAVAFACSLLTCIFLKNLYTLLQFLTVLSI